MTAIGNLRRRWSPWRLRSELRFIRAYMADFRAGELSSTDIERLYRLTGFVLDGEPMPWDHAMRYSVNGRTLHIDATPDGGCWENVERGVLRDLSRPDVPRAADTPPNGPVGPESQEGSP